MLRDKQNGDIAEQKVIDIFIKAGWKAEKNVDKATRALYDIEVVFPPRLETLTRIEVKNDLYAAKSGNLAIEIYNTRSNKPSGLTVTEAKLWAVNLDDELWIGLTSVLKAFVEKEKPTKVVNNAGDGNAAILLFRKDQILPAVFHRIDNLEIDDLEKLILELINE